MSGLECFFVLFCWGFFLTLQCFIFFQRSHIQNVKIRIIKRLVVKLGYKRREKPATTTFRVWVSV